MDYRIYSNSDSDITSLFIGEIMGEEIWIGRWTKR